MPTEPPAGAGGKACFWPRNFRLSSSWESSNCGRSPGRAGSGGEWKYGCFNASIALTLFFQSSLSNSLSSEIAKDPCSRKTVGRLPRLNSNSLIPSHPGNSNQPGIFSSLGEPTSSNIWCAWLRSLFPARIGRPLNISPNTQPTPHMSMAVV